MQARPPKALHGLLQPSSSRDITSLRIQVFMSHLFRSMSRRITATVTVCAPTASPRADQPRRGIAQQPDSFGRNEDVPDERPADLSEMRGAFDDPEEMMRMIVCLEPNAPVGNCKSLLNCFCTNPPRRWATVPRAAHPDRARRHGHQPGMDSNSKRAGRLDHGFGSEHRCSTCPGVWHITTSRAHRARSPRD
jgi:hypothetical protein